VNQEKSMSTNTGLQLMGSTFSKRTGVVCLPFFDFQCRLKRKRVKKKSKEMSLSTLAKRL
jgi:hypothetical protein